MDKVKKITLTGLPLLLLSACVDINIDNGVTIESPIANSFLLKPDVDSQTAVIAYEQQPERLDVFINGQVIPTESLYITDKKAEIPISEFSEFLKQGENTLSVNPLQFGPSRKFIVDTAGPQVIIKEVQCSTVLCNDASDIITVKGELKDPSQISSLTLEALSYDNHGGTDASGFPTGKIGGSLDAQTADVLGKTFTVDISKGEVYRFRATDTNSYESETLYLAGGQELNPIFKARVGDSALNLLAPKVADNASGVTAQALNPDKPNYSSGLANLKIMQSGDGSGHKTPDTEQADIQCALNKRTWNPAGVYADIVKEMRENCSYTGEDGETMYMYVGEMVTDTAQVNDLGAAAGDKLDINMVIADGDDANSWGTKVKLREQLVSCKHDLYLKDYWKNGWLFEQYWHTRGVTCTINDEVGLLDGGLLSLLYGAEPLEDGYKYAQLEIDTTTISGAMGLSVKDGFVRVSLDDTTIKPEGLNVEDNGLGGLIGLVEGILPPIIKMVMQGTLDNALQRLSFPLTLESKSNGTAFFVEPKAYQIYTQNDGAEVNLYADFTGVMKADAQSIIDAGFDKNDIQPALGSLYVEEQVPAPSPDSGNIEVMVNSNFINQSLLALYEIGMTHLTVYNSELLFGPTATDEKGINGKTRVRMIPAGPATFNMAGDQTSQASIRYVGAEMVMERFDGSQWERSFSLNVDIEAGVLMHAENDKFFMTILGDPDISVNKVVNNTFIPVSEALIETMLNGFLTIVTPYLASKPIEIQLPDIESSDGSKVGFKTKKIGAANAQHLNVGIELIAK